MPSNVATPIRSLPASSSGTWMRNLHRKRRRITEIVILNELILVCNMGAPVCRPSEH